MVHKTHVGDRGTIHYWIDGVGEEAVLFAHGATMDHGLFEDQIAYFAPRYRVLTWDVPLHGLSRPYRDFSLRNAAIDLLTLVDLEHIPAVHLVGQSMGGYITQIAAAFCPTRVRTITTIGSSPVQLSYYSAFDRWLLSLTPFLINLYPYRVLIHTTARQIALTEQARVYALQTLKTYTKAEIAVIMADTYRGLLQVNQTPLSCPILIVYGDRDTTGKVKAYCDRWAMQEERQLKVISNAAHNANMDNPTEFNRMLATFITSASS